MKVDAIFTNPYWDEAAQVLFWETLKKKRTQKLYFVRTKAFQLAKSKTEWGIRHAINLLDGFVQEYLQQEAAILGKSKYPRVVKMEHSDLCKSIGNYYAKLLEFEKVEEYYLLGAKIHESYPNDPDLQARRCYDGYLELAEIYIEHEVSEKAEQFLTAFEKAMTENENVWPLARLHAELAYLTGNWKKTDGLMKKHYKQSEFADWETLGKAPYTDVMEQEVNDPGSAAEAIIIYHHIACPEIFNKNLAALEKLDGLLKGNIKATDGEDYSTWTYTKEFMLQHMLPELGAYLGEVWVNEFNGAWELGDTLMQARVRIGKDLKNPFEFAYKALYWLYRLHKECYNV